MSDAILCVLVILWFVVMVYALTRDHREPCDPEDCKTCPFPPCGGVNLRQNSPQPGTHGQQKSFQEIFQNTLDNNNKVKYNSNCKERQ